MTTATLSLDPGAAAVGSCLLSERVARDVCDLLADVDVESFELRAVLTTVRGLLAEGEPVDPVTVLPRARRLVPGVTALWLADLVQGVPNEASGPYYARQAAADALLRRVGVAGVRLQDLAGKGAGEDAGAILDRARAYLADIEPQSDRLGQLADTLGDVFDRVDDQKRVVRGLPTGLVELDGLLTGGGLRPGQMVIIAARPGTGKSVLALDLARQAARWGPVGLVSLEMTAGDLNDRLVAAEARVNVGRVSDGTPTDDELSRMTRHRQRISSLPIFLADGDRMCPSQVGAFARRIKAKHGLALLVVDYFGLLSAEPGDRRDDRVILRDRSRSMKMLARELGVPVVVVVQLNRNITKRTGDDARPRLDDLRESGDLEQDADIVLMLDRPELRNPETFRAGEIDVHVTKQRGGRLGVVTACFEGHFSRIVDWMPGGMR